MSTLVAWRRLAQLGPFHWRNVAPGRAARVALGVVVPLGLGWASGHVDYGAYAALGAAVQAARELREQGSYGFGEQAAVGRAAIRAAFTS